MPCKNGWTDCQDCLNVGPCIAGLYIPIEDNTTIIKAAKIAEEVVTEEAIKSAHSIKGTWQEEFLRLPAEEIWEWMARYKRPGNINYKEPLKAGPSKPGGGSKSRNHKKPKKEKPEYMKILGM